MGLLFDTTRPAPRTKKKNVIKLLVEVYAEARGIKRGEKRANAQSAAWYARMKQAEREGRDFSEPPPFLDDDTDEK